MGPIVVLVDWRSMVSILVFFSFVVLLMPQQYGSTSIY